MRPLTEDESKLVFEKLANYIASTSQLLPSFPRTYPPSKGKNVVHLVDRQGDAHCFRLHKGRVYYVSEASMRLSISVARSDLVSLGTCLGKFSKSGKFKLHITSLDYLAQYAKYKVSFGRNTVNTIFQTDMIRCGSSRTVKCLFYTVTTSSRHIWAVLPRTHQSTRVLLCTA
jgi:ribosome biogenesis protein Nip4